MPAATEQAPKASRVSSVKVPGQASAPAADQASATAAAFDPDADEQLIADAAGFDDGAAAAPESPVLTLTQAQLDAAIAKAISQSRAADRAAAAAAKPENFEAQLPNESDIDPKTIKAMTLTKQGYVVPDNYGTPANQVGRAL